MGDDKTKGLHPVVPTYGTPEPSALAQIDARFPACEQPLAKPSLGHVGDDDDDNDDDDKEASRKKKGLHNDFPDFGTPPAKPELGQVGDNNNNNASKKKGIDAVFPTWEK